MWQTYHDLLKRHNKRVPGGAFEAVAKEMQIPKSVVKAIHESMRTSKASVVPSTNDQKSVYEAVCKLQEEKCKEEKIFEKVAKNLGITSFKARDFYSNALFDLATEVCNLNYVC